MPAMNPSAGDSDLTEKAASTIDGGETSLRRSAPALRLPPFTKVKRDQDDSEEDSDDEYARFKAASGPTTPNISETAAQLRRNLSISGLQELAHTPRSQIRKSAVSKVWRPQDEVARMPNDWERLVVHVVRGGLRAGNLAFALRATLMCVLELVKALRTRKFNRNSFGIALFGPRNFRFAALFGLWAALYKAVHNALRLMTPPPVKKPRSRTSSAADTAMFTIEKGDGNTSPDEARSGTSTPRSGRAALEGKSPEEKASLKSKQKRRAFMPDPRSKVWHAYIAGAISALAVLVETADNRISLAQQLFVRGLEGQYNVAHERGLINIPYGAVITFGLACGQIMWAWLESPESLDKGYTRWITNASHVAPRVTDVYRDIRHKGVADADFVLQKWFPGGKVPDPISTSPLRYADVAPNTFNRRGIKGKNVRKIVEWMDATRKGDCGDIIDCSLVHPWETSHWRSPIDRFIEVTRWILPVYLTLHFVPAIFLRPGKFLKDPLGATIRSLRGSVRSSSFLGVFVIIFQTQFCAQHSLYQFIQRREFLNKNVPTWFKQMLISSWLKWFAGFTTCLSLFVDDSRRRAELAAYVLPKGMESAWSVLRQKSYVPFVPGGDLLLTSAGMSLVMGTYAQNPEHLSGLVRRIVYQFVGRN